MIYTFFCEPVGKPLSFHIFTCYTTQPISISTQAFEARASGYYEAAKHLGIAAIILAMISLMWTLAWGIIITAVSAACTYGAGICD